MAHSDACAPRAAVVSSSPGLVVLRFWGPDLGQPAEWHDYCPWPPAPPAPPDRSYVGGETQRWTFGPRWHWFRRLLVDLWWPRREADPAMLRAHFWICWHLGLAGVFGTVVMSSAFWLARAPGAVVVQLAGLAGFGVYLLALTRHARRLLR